MAFNNPVKQVFERAESHENSIPMTLEGTMAKLALLLCTTIGAAGTSWWLFFAQSKLFMPLAALGALAGLVLGFIAVFRPTAAQYIALPYAVCQGFTMGALSAIAELQYPGIAIAVTSLTTATAAGMLLLYRLEIIKVTDTLKALILSATLGLALTYVLISLFNLIGIVPTSFYTSASSFSIVFSLFAVAVAAFNLLLDFNLIEESVERQLPKYMEWYGAFAVLVTLIWLYLEMLRLAQKLARRRN